MFQEKKRKIDFQDGGHGGHLKFPSETTVAIFLSPVLPTKFLFNWPFNSGEDAEKDFKDGGQCGHLGFLIGTV